jgi:deazaflavin-dependent oxidoreductase (nitroreductase family)
VETTGRRAGKPRLTPLANAPFDGSTLYVLAVYGDASAFVKNLRANPVVRVKRRGRWRIGAAELLDPTPEAVARLGLYARWVLLRIGDNPKIVKMTMP